jgi:hypothetical protein
VDQGEGPCATAVEGNGGQWTGKQRRPTTWNPLTRKTEEHFFATSDLELIVVSPLTRALQTFDLGLKPVLPDPMPIVIALPLASERLYLVSDQGRLRSDLETDWGNAIDFDTGFRFQNKVIEEWWFGLDDQRGSRTAIPTGITSKSYREWSPQVKIRTMLALVKMMSHLRIV